MRSFECLIDQAQSDSLAKRPFSLARADRALVLIKPIVSDIVNWYTRLMELQELIDATDTEGDSLQHKMSLREMIVVVERLREYLDELDDIGVKLLDWQLGTVEFPGVDDGRGVCWYWRHGQESVMRSWQLC